MPLNTPIFWRPRGPPWSRDFITYPRGGSRRLWSRRRGSRKPLWTRWLREFITIWGEWTASDWLITDWTGWTNEWIFSKESWNFGPLNLDLTWSFARWGRGLSFVLFAAPWSRRLLHGVGTFVCVCKKKFKKPLSIKIKKFKIPLSIKIEKI